MKSSLGKVETLLIVWYYELYYKNVLKSIEIKNF